MTTQPTNAQAFGLDPLDNPGGAPGIPAPDKDGGPKLNAGRGRFRPVISAEGFRRCPWPAAPTPIRPAMALSLSSISGGMLGGGILGRNNAPNVVPARDGLLDGGSTTGASTTDDRADPGTVEEVAMDPTRGGGRGRGAHPVRRGRGLTAGRGDEPELPDGDGEDAEFGEPLGSTGEDGETMGPLLLEPATFATGVADDEDWRVMVDLGGVVSISTVNPRSFDVTNWGGCAGGFVTETGCFGGFIFTGGAVKLKLNAEGCCGCSVRCGCGAAGGDVRRADGSCLIGRAKTPFWWGEPDLSLTMTGSLSIAAITWDEDADPIVAGPRSELESNVADEVVKEGTRAPLSLWLSSSSESDKSLSVSSTSGRGIEVSVNPTLVGLGGKAGARSPEATADASRQERILNVVSEG